MALRRYTIIDGKPALCSNTQEFAACFENADRTLLKDCLAEGIEVSTVFLGIDHSPGVGEPVLWETMVFNGRKEIVSNHTTRYSSKEAALQGHAEILALVKADLDP